MLFLLWMKMLCLRICSLFYKRFCSLFYNTS